LFRGVQIGTNRKLCNIFSKTKPCEECLEEEKKESKNVQVSSDFFDVSEQDFIDFFGKTRKEVLEPLNMFQDENYLKRFLFKDAKYSGAADIVKTYRDSDYFLIHLNSININNFKNIQDIPVESNFIFELCVKKFPNPKGIKVLDYGCGSGIYGIKLALLGYDVTLADIPHKTFEFLKYVCNKYKLNIKFQNLSENNYALTDKFDYIICTDVLEHVDEPEELLRNLIEHLDDNGYMYLATFFDDMNGHDPSHLYKNTVRYNNYQQWLGRVVQMGIVPTEFDKNKCERGFRKIISIK
jgi:2-polyprenyl-3-methyl-5-hydroxy-6-metoxy-1,4-benzoquinol methylase